MAKKEVFWASRDWGEEHINIWNEKPNFVEYKYRENFGSIRILARLDLATAKKMGILLKSKECRKYKLVEIKEV